MPPRPRASSQLNSAVRALPTCSRPVGLGAKRSRMTVRSLPAPADEHDGVHRHGLAAADGVDAFVGLALDADARRLDAEHAPPGWRGWDRGAARASGRSAMTTASTLTMSKPASRASVTACASIAMLDAPFHRGSVSGKWRPMSPRATAPRTASVIACASTSASECPASPFSDGTVTPPRMSGRPSTSRCKSYPVPTRMGPAAAPPRERLCGFQIGHGRDLQVGRLARHDPHREARGLGQRRLVGGHGASPRPASMAAASTSARNAWGVCAR